MKKKSIRIAMWTILLLSVVATTVACGRRVYHMTVKAEKLDAEYQDSLVPKQ